MDLISLIKNLPIDLIPILTNYNPEILSILSKDDLIKYDWFRLIRMTFSLDYSRSLCSNEQIMNVYFDNCQTRRKSKIMSLDGYMVITGLDGTLMSCGHNECGQLGLGDFSNRNVFEGIKGIKNVLEVAGNEYSMIIKLSDGTLMGCGSNVYGQLGLGHNIAKASFQEIKGIEKNVGNTVIFGDFNAFIRTIDGTLMGCGHNRFGELGFGDNRDRNIFEEIKGVEKNIVEVLANGHRTIVRFRDGRLMGCGHNAFGELGLGDYRERNIFEEIKGVPKNIAEVIFNDSDTIVRLTDGTLMACGSNKYGELGLGDNINIKFFEEIKGIPKNIAKVTSKGYRTIIRLTDGTLLGSGDNRYGQFGFGDIKCRMFFEKIKIRKKVAQVILAKNYTMIVLTDGTLMSCGRNNYGQIGLDDIIDRYQFQKITKMNKMKRMPKNIAEVKCSTESTIIRLTDGTIMACGDGVVNKNRKKNRFFEIKEIGKILD
ncbi:MAG: chromosome condensation regulator [Hyperionvirus sp.]|uniref:Chromosome condensation regulator n=1 Tax=Hyperionvirus sp. TaxID=2487770 RepID=A0A3G5AAX5_9VIRU|nr:MAG: chromosome condensation regulator [Hyperionvirus sp.]